MSKNVSSFFFFFNIVKIINFTLTYKNINTTYCACNFILAMASIDVGLTLFCLFAVCLAGNVQLLLLYFSLSLHVKMTYSITTLYSIYW